MLLQVTVLMRPLQRCPITLSSTPSVKVIEHTDGAEATAVSNEAKLLLSLHHPNVVKAYHFMQCSKAPSMVLPSTRPSDGTAGAPSRAGGSAGGSNLTSDPSPAITGSSSLPPDSGSLPLAIPWGSKLETVWQGHKWQHLFSPAVGSATGPAASKGRAGSAARGGGGDEGGKSVARTYIVQEFCNGGVSSRVWWGAERKGSVLYGACIHKG